MAQKLLTKEILKKLPPLGATDGKTDAERKVIAKFFNPTGDQTWFLLEFDGEDTLYTFFIRTTAKSGDDGELGYSLLSEIAAIRGGFGLPIERDIHFPTGKYTLEQIKEKKGLV